ncbi:MAG: hypothetical protein ABSH49_15220 [Bryobacteraceae bacterium]
MKPWLKTTVWGCSSAMPARQTGHLFTLVIKFSTTVMASEETVSPGLATLARHHLAPREG